MTDSSLSPTARIAQSIALAAAGVGIADAIDVSIHFFSGIPRSVYVYPDDPVPGPTAAALLSHLGVTESTEDVITPGEEWLLSGETDGIVWSIQHTGPSQAPTSEAVRFPRQRHPTD